MFRRRCSYLSLDDVEEEIRVAAAAEEVTQAKRLVQAFHLLLNLRRRSARRTPEHNQKRESTNLAEHLSLGGNLRLDLLVI